MPGCGNAEMGKGEAGRKPLDIQQTGVAMKKRIKWIILAAVVAVGALLYGYAEMQSGIPVRTMVVGKGNIRAWVEARAMTTLPNIHKITMPQDGRILPIDLEAGHSVKKGQVVAQMDSADFRTALALADANVAEMEVRMAMSAYTRIEDTALVESKQVIAAMKAAGKAADELVRTNEAELDYSKWLLEMEEKLVKERASSQEKVQRAQRDYGQADSSLASSRFISKALWAITAAVELLPKYIQERLELKDLEKGVMTQRLAQARAQQSLAVRQLKRATIESPVDGMVLRRLIKDEAYLQAGNLLMEIGDMRKLEVTANILSEDVVTVRSGNAVDIYGPSIGMYRYAGRCRASSLPVLPKSRLWAWMSSGSRSLSPSIRRLERSWRQEVIPWGWPIGSVFGSTPGKKRMSSRSPGTPCSGGLAISGRSLP